MESFFKRILMIGVSDENPEYLNTKVRINNMVALSILVIAVIYTLFSWFFYPVLTWLPALAFPFILGGIALSHLRVYNFSRLVVGFTPFFVCMAYHEAIIPQGTTPIASIMVLQAAFSLLPFILYDLREKAMLSVTVSICFFCTVFFTSFDGWLEFGLDDSLFRTGIMHEITIGIAMVLISLSVSVLAMLNNISEKKSQELLAKGKLQNEELNQQREEMEKNLKRLESAQEEERKRAWASQGFSQFGTIMRQNIDPEEMFDALLAGIVKFTGTNQAGLYLVEGEGNDVQLRLQACYAYQRKKYRDHVVQPGQGLVGQVYLEKEYVYLTEIPQQYIRITSGLGDARPSALLLVPLISNEVVEGVLEIASFKPFEPYVIDFLNKMGEEIAAMVSINRINALTRQLLEEAQEQTEEMRAQEEEMRQNMEELQATQEEMHRKEREYLARIRELEAAVAG